jgi:hypothetical protein
MIMSCPYKDDIFKLVNKLKREGHDIAISCEGCYWYLRNSQHEGLFFMAGSARSFYRQLLAFAKEKGVPVND